MAELAAASDAVLVGALGVVGVLVTAIGGVIVAALGRDVKNRRETVSRTVDEFEAAWATRGRLLDGLGADLDAAHARLLSLEERESACRDRLAEALGRIEELETAVEPRRRPRG